MSNSESTKDYIYSGKIKEYETILLEFFKELGNLKNQPSKISTINSYLAIRKSLTQKELKELTGFSSGAVSKYINKTIKFGIVKRTRKEGSNEYIYYIAKPFSEMYKSASELSMDLIEPMLSKIDINLNRLEDYKTHRGYDLFKTRLEDLRKTFEAFSKIKALLFKD